MTDPTRTNTWLVRRARLLLLLCVALLSACEQSTQLERIQERGELLVATRESPTTYYRGEHGPEGLEYDLIMGFAGYIGVRARFVFPDDLAQLIDQVKHAEVHMAAAGLTRTEARARWLRFSHPYQAVTEQVVYRRGSRRPASLDAIPAGQLHVIAGSSHEESLQAHQQEMPYLQWQSVPDTGLKALLGAVNDGEVPYTVADSNELAVMRQIYRWLSSAFELSNSRSLAWAFPARGDDSLREAANRYLEHIDRNGTLRSLIEHYYGRAGQLDFVALRDFQRHIDQRLPGLVPFFREAERETGIDWRLLAAVGYQESHWNPDAVSPTGVRGIMMLTSGTARQLGLSDRRDPAQSIRGGARYLRIVEKKIPQRITQPHRLWLTLAGYNIGFGHLEDARVLTQRQGGDPDRWEDVRERLPLLKVKSHYSKLRFGRADGQQAVDYVANIRAYHQLLVWFLNHPEDLESGSGDISQLAVGAQARHSG